ncbi:uncharacterized protein LAESUDRAFT_816829 [Laetiporus sulphureus 93-53]|uniref:Uncharacterized protein n=1 Tax=Laetiporus sulphureus 93-53 TaxID=1314785 RepID=A0A165AX80_9APHY|nr:uncharacterized protein LAESUDRAFT_816829 [Laetiporus sulphureus 93-53]KZS99828.1 hypothetical protein LAESUDRAFT_816829 [Laetiporus sulphureus 93-53]
MFEIQLLNRPVLILELKSPSHLRMQSKREKADDQIRSRMFDVVGDCPLNTLHAISAMGTKLCFYTLNTQDPAATINPPAVQRHATRVNETIPANRWADDILEDAGEQRFRAIVEEIKVGCAALDV